MDAIEQETAAQALATIPQILPDLCKNLRRDYDVREVLEVTPLEALHGHDFLLTLRLQGEGLVVDVEVETIVTKAGPHPLAPALAAP